MTMKRRWPITARRLYGDTLIKLEAFASTIYTRPLYWCTRKMIEVFAADPAVQSDISSKLGI